MGCGFRRALVAAAAFPFLLAPAAFAQDLLRGPYLGKPDDADVAVVWDTAEPLDSRVDYARPGAPSAAEADPSFVTHHVVVLRGLAPGATYRYTISSGGAVLAPAAGFRTAGDASAESLAFAVIGDTSGGSVPRAIAQRLLASPAQLVLHTGDVVYPAGAQADYTSEFFAPMESLLAHAPVLPCIGNHDAATDAAAALLANFVLPQNGVAPEPRFYALRAADALFLVLDVETSSYGAGSAQYRWLESQLASSTARWKFVVLHEPLYSSSNPNTLARMILAPLFERYGVDIVFAGHEHLYERTVPIHDFTSSGPGVIYVTEGGGGAVLSDFSREDYSAYVASVYSYVIVTISGGRLTLTAHDLSGNVFDGTEISKGPPAPRRASAGEAAGAPPAPAGPRR